MISFNKNKFFQFFILSIAFFFTFGCYVIIHEIRDAIFCITIGKAYLPEAKILSCFMLIPLMALYTFLYKRLSNSNLLCMYGLLYVLMMFVASFYAFESKIIAWILYVMFEGFNPFFVSILWAFLNSISTVEDIKKKYIIITSSAKLGGICFSLVGYYLMTRISETPLCDPYIVLLRMIACSLVIVITVIMMYEKIFKPLTCNKSCNKNTPVHTQQSEGSGIDLFWKYPYVAGIFLMVLLWDVINIIFNYMRISLCLNESKSTAHFGALLFKNAIYTQLLGLTIVIIGASTITRYWGQRISLLLIPIFIGLALCAIMVFPSATTVIYGYMFMRAINYAFAYPIREGLYIPTSNEIQFKTKPYIEGFGSKIGKMFGSLYNKFIYLIPASLLLTINAYFFTFFIIAWTILAYLLGKKWEDAVKKNYIIGDEKSLK